MGCKLKTTTFSIILICLLVITACNQKEEPFLDDDQKPMVSQYFRNSSSRWVRSDLWPEIQGKIPYYNTLYFAEGQGYEFRNTASNKLLITLSGGGDWFGARVGEIGGELDWNHFVDWLLPLYSEYSIFVPEKFHWGRHIRPFWDIKNREKYTFDNLIVNYAGVIKEYLSQNDYETIIIAGHSEGGIIAPELYSYLNEFSISAIISSGAGGLVSPVDISSARRGIPLADETIKQYLNAYNQYLAAYSGDGYAQAPDEIHFRRTGEVFIPLIYSYSQQARRPFEFYKDINIPVLFIHGLLDTFVSPVSTRYVEQNLPDKPFTYIYYPDSQHYPTTVAELERMRTDIADWLREKGL